MFSKLVYLAPIAFTSAGVTALISLRIDDPRLKQALRIAAIMMTIGAALSLVQQSFQLAEALSRTERTIMEQRRLIDEERVKSADALRKAVAAEAAAEQAKLQAEAAAKDIKAQMDAKERAAREEAAASDRAARMKAEEDERKRREAAAAAEQAAALQALEAKKRQEQAAAAAAAEKAARAQSVIAQKENSCQQCCKQRAPSFYNMPANDAISGCYADCIRGVPDNYGTYLCRF